jgi:hypothetical protein
MITYRLRANPHGVPSPTHGGKVPICEHQQPIKIWLIIIQIWYWLFNEKILLGLVLRFRSSFWLNPSLNTSPEPHLQKVLPCKHPCELACRPTRKWSNTIIHIGGNIRVLLLLLLIQPHGYTFYNAIYKVYWTHSHWITSSKFGLIPFIDKGFACYNNWWVESGWQVAQATKQPLTQAIYVALPIMSISHVHVSRWWVHDTFMIWCDPYYPSSIHTNDTSSLGVPKVGDMVHLMLYDKW